MVPRSARLPLVTCESLNTRIRSPSLEKLENFFTLTTTRGRSIPIVRVEKSSRGTKAASNSFALSFLKAIHNGEVLCLLLC